MTADRQNTPQDAPHAPVSDFQAPQAPGDGATAPDAAERAQRYAEALGKAACRALGSCGDFHRHEEAFTRAVMAVADQEQAELRGEVDSLNHMLAILASVAPDTATPGEATCVCGSPDAYSLNPAEVVVHRTDGPCIVEPAASSADDKAGE